VRAAFRWAANIQKQRPIFLARAESTLEFVDRCVIVMARNAI
jgi:hypothetical protein